MSDETDESNDTGCMKFVPTSEPINLSDWGDCLDGETMRTMLNDFPPRLDFPITWDDGSKKPSDGRNGPPVSDPVTLYLELPFAECYPDERVCFSCSLEDVIDEFIEVNKNYVDHKITSASSQIIAAKITARLRELADKLENSCGETTPDEQCDD